MTKFLLNVLSAIISPRVPKRFPTASPLQPSAVPAQGQGLYSCAVLTVLTLRTLSVGLRVFLKLPPPL